MVQAARSGRQNIAEGSRASAASSNTELRLLNTAAIFAGAEQATANPDDWEPFVAHELTPLKR